LGLPKVIVGVIGLIVALILSIVASGRDVELEPYKVEVVPPLRGSLDKVLDLNPDRAYLNLTLLVKNNGMTRCYLNLGKQSYTINPLESVVITVVRVDELVSLECPTSNGERGSVTLVVYGMVREGVNVLLSLIALLTMLLSLVIGGVGVVEFIIGRERTP